MTKPYNPRIYYKLSSSNSATADNTSNDFTDTAHGLSNEDLLYLGGTTPSELDTSTMYYVVNKTDDTFQLSLTEGGSAITFTDDGTDVVYYKTYSIGQMSWFTPTLTQNNMTRIIPRAEGVQIYSGEEMGGGQITISVQAFKTKSTRLEIEQYLYNLMTDLANTYGTLLIDDTLTLTDCYLQDITPSQESNTWSRFSITFIKSV